MAEENLPGPGLAISDKAAQRGGRLRSEQRCSGLYRHASRQECGCDRFPAILAHGVAAHLDAVGIVNQPVEDTVSGGGIADLFVPARHSLVSRILELERMVLILIIKYGAEYRSPSGVQNARGVQMASTLMTHKSFGFSEDGL